MALDKNDAKILAEAFGNAVKDGIKNSRSDTAGLPPETIARLEGLPAPKKWREVPCKSEETGAAFIACVVESKSMAAGRIVELKSYTMPSACIVYVSQGGLVPDGMPILREGGAPPPGTNPNTIPKQQLEMHYLQWRWVEFWQKDLKRYVGKELRRSLTVDDAAFAAPWQEGSVRGAEE